MLWKICLSSKIFFYFLFVKYCFVYTEILSSTILNFDNNQSVSFKNINRNRMIFEVWKMFYNISQFTVIIIYLFIIK